jgi:bifunctional non-homologous end joining protein LigD
MHAHARFVIGGWIPNSNRTFSALVLGDFIDGELRYVGQVQTDLAPRVVARVLRMLTPRAESPFKDRVAEAGVKFCEPALRIGVEYQHMTDDGYLRHASFRRFADELITEL